MGVIPSFSPDATPQTLRASLGLIARSHSLRCDAKQAERRFADLDKFLATVPHFVLGEFLPLPLIKGEQPRYLETLEPEGVPVISTITIQHLHILTDLCRFISEEDYEAQGPDRKPQSGDVLVTVDGGTSIGKPVLFESEDPFAVDSHVAILRPQGISPKLLVYLLASPIGQVQFQQAESGASGQTGVSEEDIRRFRFPNVSGADAERIEKGIDAVRAEVSALEAQVRAKEAGIWAPLDDAVSALIKNRPTVT